MKREWLCWELQEKVSAEASADLSFSTKATCVLENQNSELQDILPGALINEITCISQRGLVLNRKKSLGGKGIEDQ